MIFVLVLTAFILCTASAHEVEEASAPPAIDQEALLKWIRLADEKMASIALDAPLRDGFTPGYLGNRTVEHVVARQTSRLRSLVATTMIETLGDEARTCIPPHHGAQAVKTVKTELATLGFTVYVVKDVEWCAGAADGIVVRVPPPASDPPRNTHTETE